MTRCVMLWVQGTPELLCRIFVWDVLGVDAPPPCSARMHSWLWILAKAFVDPYALTLANGLAASKGPRELTNTMA